MPVTASSRSRKQRGWRRPGFPAVIRPPISFRSCHALLREDAGFHMVQNLQAAACQYLAWQGDPDAAPILIAAARYLTAHSPTPRARHQTAEVARRLMRGGAVHEDESEAEA